TRPGDPGLHELVRDLRETSPEFRKLWDGHDVAVRAIERKDVRHPAVGLIALRCQILEAPEAAAKIRVLLPVDGTDAAERLELLRVIGTQDISTDVHELH